MMKRRILLRFLRSEVGVEIDGFEAVENGGRSSDVGGMMKILFVWLFFVGK